MSAPQFSDVILQLGAQIDQIASAFSSDGYQTIATMVKAPLGAACLLFITLKGFAITAGLIKTPMQELTKSAIRIGVIYTFVMSWGLFSGYVVAFLSSVAEHFGAALMHINPLKLPTPESVGINASIQKVLREIMSVGALTMAKGSMMNFTPIFTATMIYFAGGAVIGLAFFELMCAKLFVAILFCVAPLFIAFTLFEQTRGFFDKWLGNLVGFTFVLIFVSAAVGFAMSLLFWAVDDTYVTKAVNIGSVGWLPLFLCSLFCIKAILEATRLGLGIGGACTSTSGIMGGVLAGGLGLASSASRTAMPLSGKALMAAKQGVGVMKHFTPAGSQKMLVQAGKQALSSVKAIKQKIRGVSK
jgi:type IV secretion system protein VirB6